MIFFSNNLGLLLSATENVLNNFKNRLFPIKNLDKISSSEPTPEPAKEPTKHNKSKLRLQKELMNEIIAIKKRHKWWNILEKF